MPDIFDQIHAEATGGSAPAPTGGGDIFDQIHAQSQAAQPAPGSQPLQGFSPAQYFQKHPGMDPLAVEQAFNQLQGRGAIPQAVMPEQARMAGQGSEGFMHGMSNAALTGIAQPVQGMMGLMNPQLGQAIQQNVQTAYGAPTGAGAFVGRQVANAANLPYMMTPAGRVVSAAGAAGNERIDIANRRDQGEQVGGAEEVARTSGMGALDYGTNLLFNKFGGQIFGNMAPTVGKTATQIAGAYAKKFGQDALTNEALVHAGIAASNLIAGRPINEGMGAGSIADAVVQTAGQLGLHALTPHQPTPTPEAEAPARPQPPQQTAEQYYKKQFEAKPQENVPHENVPERPVAPVEAKPPVQEPRPAEGPKPEAPVEAAKTEGTPAVQPEPQRAKTLPELPSEAGKWSHGELKSWAEDNGFDTEGANGKLKLRNKITDQLLSQEKALRRTDPLTEAPNKIKYDEDAANIFKDADAKKEHTAVVETDIGGLKVMNTTYGHEGGDEMLKLAHQAMREELRVPEQRGGRAPDYAGSAAYRVGGDEFPMILRNVDSPEKVQAVMDRVNKNFDAKIAAKFPDMPEETRPFIAHNAEIRAPGDTRPIDQIRAVADKGVEPVKSKIKATRDIPEGRTEYTQYLAERRAGMKPEETTYGKSKGMKPAEAPKAAEPDFFERIKAKGAEIGKRLATEEEGGATMEASRKFAEKDVLPKVEAAVTGLKKLKQGLTNTFGAQKGAGAEEVKSLLKARGAELAQRGDQIHDQTRKAEALIDAMPVAEQHAITDAAERGTAQANPEMQKTADYIRSQYDDRLQQIQDRDPEFRGLPDYMAHAWKQPDRANSVLQEFLSRRPIQGDTGFKKGRVIAYQSEGIKAGLEPVTDNPVTMMKLKVHQMDKWITAFDLKKDLETRGLITDAPKAGKIPEGYSQVNDPMFRGKMLPDPVASVVNNTLSSGPLGHPLFGPALRGITGIANTVNQANLSLSAFHATESAINSAVSEMALGLKKTIEGKPVEGVKSMGLALTGVGPAARDYFTGTKMLKEWLHPGTTDAQTATIVQAMKAQGGRAGMDKFYTTNMTDKMMHAFRTGNYIGAAIRAPLAAMETTAKPIMNYLVPRLKMGAFFQMAQHELAKNPGMTGEELSKSMGDAWRSVDNRFGEMVHDNRFWSQTARHVASATFRSVGWNFGTVDELGGGALDWAKMAKRVATGEKAGDVTHKMAYTVALPALVGTWGAAIHYALNGTAPSSVKDLFFPKTGEKDQNGDDVRMNLPTYMKDVFNVAHSPLGTIANKLHPMVGMTIDMLKNKDFYGTKIVNEDDPFYKRMIDRAEYAAKQSRPISIQQLTDTTLPTRAKIAGALGVTKAPKYLSQSDAMQEAYKAIDEAQPIGGRTAEATAKSNLVSGFVTRMRKDDPSVDADIDKAVDAGKLTNADYKTIVKRSQGPTGLAGLIQRPELRGKPELIERIWDKMTPSEKEEHSDAVYKMVAHEKANPDKRDALLEKINKETTRMAGVQ